MVRRSAIDVERANLLRFLQIGGAMHRRRFVPAAAVESSVLAFVWRGHVGERHQFVPGIGARYRFPSPAEESLLDTMTLDEYPLMALILPIMLSPMPTSGEFMRSVISGLTTVKQTLHPMFNTMNHTTLRQSKARLP